MFQRQGIIQNGKQYNKRNYMHSTERIILVCIIVLLTIALIIGKDIRPIMYHKEKTIEQNKKPVPHLNLNKGTKQNV